jgi:hypothetical protein
MLILTCVVKGWSYVNCFDMFRQVIASHGGFVSKEFNTRHLALVYLFIYLCTDVSRRGFLLCFMGFDAM